MSVAFSVIFMHYSSCTELIRVRKKKAISNAGRNHTSFMAEALKKKGNYSNFEPY